MAAVESVDPYAKFALPLYKTRDSAHNADHIRRIIARLDDLSEGVSPPPRPAMLHFLACFHGLGNRMDQDQKLVNQTRRFLVELGWTDQEMAEGLLLLERHCVDPQTSEERIVHDANYVEVLGAFGIAKALTKGGSERQSYEQTIAIFEGYLHQVQFRTPRGADIAQDGRQYAASFLDRLRTELTPIWSPTR